MTMALDTIHDRTRRERLAGDLPDAAALVDRSIALSVGRPGLELDPTPGGFEW
jgi:hypothetical protein